MQKGARIGEALATTDRARGGEQYKAKPTGAISAPVAPTLAELGLSGDAGKKRSARIKLRFTEQQQKNGGETL
jgi:hypothetical protein